MKTFTTTPPPGGINFNLLCEQASDAFGGDLLGTNTGPGGEVIIHLQDASVYGQAEVDALAAAHNSAQDSASSQANTAVAAAMTTLIAVDTAAPVVPSSDIIAALITTVRGY